LAKWLIFFVFKILWNTFEANNLNFKF